MHGITTRANLMILYLAEYLNNFPQSMHSIKNLKSKAHVIYSTKEIMCDTEVHYFYEILHD